MWASPMAFAQQVFSPVYLTLGSGVHAHAMRKPVGKLAFIPAEAHSALDGMQDYLVGEQYARVTVRVHALAGNAVRNHLSPRFARWKPAPVPLPNTITPFP